ncbi:MAG TPA: hypothetical protein VF614_13045 [Chthoniobacteraceae bacterium]
MTNQLFLLALVLLGIAGAPLGLCQSNPTPKYEDYIRTAIPSKKEIDVFLNELSWAKFDPDLGYILGNYIPRDGVDKSSTISTAQANGARRSFIYTDKPCRINTYGNSFTQCHQVSDGETWQEYLAAHLGEPIRNFGMGGYGVNQAYRRMVKNEQTAIKAEYLVFYIWGDDHVRSLFRCRYVTVHGWMKDQEAHEGIGRMFHANFWPNVEMNLGTGQLEEHESRIRQKSDLYRMTDGEWMYENLKDDLALQMALYKDGKISDIDTTKLKRLADHLGHKISLDDPNPTKEAVSQLVDKYAFAATKYLLNKVKAFAAENERKVLIVVFDPYRVTKSLLRQKERYDQEIIDFLRLGEFNYFDMNLVHLDDFKSFNLSIDDYFKRYFIGHYSPAGNHFFAHSIKPKIVEWLNPKPITYKESDKQMTEFKGYLEGL